MQYWGIGFFFTFLAVISLWVGHDHGDRMLMLLAITGLVADMVILGALRVIFYHYFLISLTFCAMAVGKALTVSRDLAARLIILTILILSVATNLPTIDFYLNPSHAHKFHVLAAFVAANMSEKEAVFGEPVMTNYVSFVTGKRLAAGYLDTYLRHLIYEGEQRVIARLWNDMPQLFIEMEGYYLTHSDFGRFILSNYRVRKTISGIPTYHIYQLR
jgi:hypothetical protein